MKDLVKKLDTIIIKYKDIEKNLLQHDNLDKELPIFNKLYSFLNNPVIDINSLIDFEG